MATAKRSAKGGRKLAGKPRQAKKAGAGGVKPKTTSGLSTRGRVSKYKPEMIAQAEQLCHLGATDVELAKFFGVSTRTLLRWQHQHPEFCRAIKTGKDVADERVERSLYQRAVGYERPAVKIFMPANKDEPVYAPYREAVTADVTAGIFWLKNRRPDVWREKSTHEHTGKDGEALFAADDAAKIDLARWVIAKLRAGAEAESETPPKAH